MTNNPLCELKKDLDVLRSRIEVWETTLEANKRVMEHGVVDEERVAARVEFLEDASGGDTQAAPSNKRKHSEMQVPSTKDIQAAVVKKNATVGQRIEILNWYHANGRNQTKTAQHFDAVYPNLKIKQPLVSRWIKDESRWRDEWENSYDSHSVKRTRCVPPKSLCSSLFSPSISLSPSTTLNDPTTDPIVKTEKSDDPIVTGVHQTVNPINTEALSIPPKEPGTTDEAATDNEIYLDSQEMHENDTKGVDWSDNVDDDLPCPTRREVMQAVSVLKRYLAAIDGPFAREVEATLTLFVNEIHLIEARSKLKPTLLTDYFPRK